MKRILMVAILMGIALAIFVPTALAQQGPEIDISNNWGDQADIAIDTNGNAHLAFISSDCGSMYQVFGSSPNRYAVIDWDTGHYDKDEWGRFQAVLYESGNVEFNILDSAGDKYQITGVNQGTTNGVSVSGTPTDNSSYRFIWDGISDYNVATIPFSWVNLSSGTCTGANRDDSSGTVTFGFNFTFYGTAYDTVYVSSNGYMSFTDTSPTSTSGPAAFPSDYTSAANAIAPLWSDWYPTQRQIFYTMLDPNGSTLIDDTRISSGAAPCTRPAIAVDSDDDVHILWRDQRWDDNGSQEVTYSQLNPSLDDQDGTPANEAAITVIDDTRLSNIGNWNIYQIRMAIDPNDDIHIVWDDDDDYNIYYMKIDENGTVLVAATVIRNGAQDRALPDVALDSSGNVHVVWSDHEGTTYDEIYYMMLDTVGNPMIEATLLTNSGSDSKRARIVIDNDDNAHITWHDKRGTTHEIYYTKINPSQDDQNGDAANEPAITVIDDTPLTPDDGNNSQHQAMSIGCGQYIHITWYESGSGPDVNIHYMMLDKDGTQIVGERALTSTGQASRLHNWTLPYIAVDMAGKAHIVWCDERNGQNEVFYTSYNNACCVCPWDPWDYDANHDLVISKQEALAAVVHFFGGQITKQQALEVIVMFFG